MANGNGNGWVAPQTEKPDGLAFRLVMMAIALAGVFCLLFWSWWYIGLIATFVVLAFSTRIYTEGVPQYYAIILMNNFYGWQRVAFQGINLKYPWETAQLNGSAKDYINLRTEVSGVIENETYATSDGLVVGTYVFTMKIDVNSNASDNVLRWASYEPESVLRVLRALSSRTFLSFCETRTTEELIHLDKETMNGWAFGPGKLAEFEQKYGVVVDTILEDLDRDPKLQAARDVVAQAKSYAEAIQGLVETTGMSWEAATQFLKVMNFPGATEHTWKVDVTGLDLSQLQNFHFLGATPKLPGATKGKGGK
jgi:hypothetical protein